MTFNYCGVNVTTVGTVVPPETALIVTCEVIGVAGVVVAACCGVMGEEQPVMAVAAINRRARSDAPASCILRFRHHLAEEQSLHQRSLPLRRVAFELITPGLYRVIFRDMEIGELNVEELRFRAARRVV